MSARFKTAPVAAPAPGRLSTVLWAGLEQRRNAPRNTAPEGVYPDSVLEWTDRLELVQGGCKRGGMKETACYDNWTAAFIARILENPMANTIVLLSVGAGVLELRSIETALQVRGGGYTAIKKIWLIDPFVDASTGVQVALQYTKRDMLRDVNVTYFTGDDCYNKAIETLRESPDTRVATIGALNVSFLISDNPLIVENYRNMLHFVLQCATDNRREAMLYVVQSWHNERDKYALKDEQAGDFVVNQDRDLERKLRLLRQPLGMQAMDLSTDNGGHGTAASAVPRGVP